MTGILIGAGWICAITFVLSLCWAAGLADDRAPHHREGDLMGEGR